MPAKNVRSTIHRFSTHRFSTLVVLGVSFLAALLLGSGTATAQDITFRVDDASGLAGSLATVAVEADSDVALQGWSFSVCHDAPTAEPIECALGIDVEGLDLIFEMTELSDDGVTATVVLDTFADLALPAGDARELARITYLLQSNSGDSDLTLCDTLGDPPLGAVAVSDLLPVTPELVSGVLSVGVDAPLFTYTVASATLGYDAATGDDSFSVVTTFAEHPSSPSAPNEVFGLHLALTHDDEYLSVNSVEIDEEFDDLNGGDGPEVVVIDILDGEWRVDLVFSTTDATVVLDASTTQTVALIQYNTNPDSLINIMDPVLTLLEWSDELTTTGLPSNSVQVNFDGGLSDMVMFDGLVTLIPGGPFFARGDCSADGDYNVGDGVAILGHVFLAVDAPCEDACDVNNDGLLDLTDAIDLLEHLFDDGPPPAVPFPGCGADPMGDPLGCASFPPCS